MGVQAEKKKTGSRQDRVHTGFKNQIQEQAGMFTNEPMRQSGREVRVRLAYIVSETGETNEDN